MHPEHNSSMPHPSMPPDRELIRLLGDVARSQAGALRELYDAVAPRLYGICLHLLKQRDLADEALQETFIRIWHHAGEYHEERGAPLNWMASIARYRALDLLRRKRDQAPNSDVFLATLADDRPDPLEMSLRGASALALKGCLEELSEPQRNSIQMAYFHGLSHDELAVALGTPLGTVKSWIRRGLMSLKRCLER